jgi:hypothetical protein
MLLTLQLKLKIRKGHTPSITTVTITVYLKENGKKIYFCLDRVTDNIANTTDAKNIKKLLYHNF